MLRQSLACVPAYEQVEMIKMMAEEAGEKKKTIELARTMKLEKIDAAVIAKITRLSLEEIAGL